MMGPVQTEEVTYPTWYAAKAAGVSYRMLDYWLRTGAVRIADPATPGSGHSRRFTEDEVETLVAVARTYRLAVATIDQFRSGLMWEMASAEKEMTSG